MSNPNVSPQTLKSVGFQTMDSRIDSHVAEDLGLTTPDNFERHVAAGREVARMLAEARLAQDTHPSDSDASHARDASHEDNRLREGMGYGAGGYTPPTEEERITAQRGRELARQITAKTSAKDH